MLSSPVPKSPVWSDRPLQDPAPDGPGAAQAASQAPHGVAQLSLPLAEESVAAATGLAQPDAGGATQVPSAIDAPDAASSVAPVPATTAAAKATVQSRRRLAATVVSLLVVAMAAGLVYLFKEEPRPGPNQAQTAGPARSPEASIAQPRSAPEPVRANTGQTVAEADSSSVARTQAQPETPAPRAAAPNPPQSKPVSPKEPRKPVAVKEQGQPPSAVKAQAGNSSPRQACAGKERYALLQCMEAQCAKNTWTKHEQCVRLRKDRKL
jgi:hypothetical protein